MPTSTLKLAAKMQNSDCDPARSFCAWLKIVTRHAWSVFWGSRGQEMATGCSQAVHLFLTVEAREDLVQRSAQKLWLMRRLAKQRVGRDGLRSAADQVAAG